MLNSGGGGNILTLVLSENKFLNETKNHNPLPPPPPCKLNGRSLMADNLTNYKNSQLQNNDSSRCIYRTGFGKGTTNVEVETG